MKIIGFILFSILISLSVKAQVVQKDSIKMGYVLTENDTILNDTIQLEEIVISKDKLDPEARNNFYFFETEFIRRILMLNWLPSD